MSCLIYCNWHCLSNSKWMPSFNTISVCQYPSAWPYPLIRWYFLTSISGNFSGSGCNYRGRCVQCVECRVRSLQIICEKLHILATWEILHSCPVLSSTLIIRNTNFLLALLPCYLTSSDTWYLTNMCKLSNWAPWIILNLMENILNSSQGPGKLSPGFHPTPSYSLSDCCLGDFNDGFLCLEYDLMKFSPDDLWRVEQWPW